MTSHKQVHMSEEYL